MLAIVRRSLTGALRFVRTPVSGAGQGIAKAAGADQ
jgi:hypothetical protein